MVHLVAFYRLTGCPLVLGKISGLGNDTLQGGKGVDTYSWSTTTMGAGDQNVIKDGKGSKINLTDAIESLQIGGKNLDDVSKGKLAIGTDLNANNNVAFVDGKYLQVDLNGDGQYVAGEDFQIEIVGTTTIKGVVYNAKTDTFDLI